MIYGAPQPAMVYGAPAPVSAPMVYGAPQPKRKRREIGQIGIAKKPITYGAPGPVHMLVVALDYKGSGNELTCTIDGNNMQALARAAGVQDITVLYDRQCTKDGVMQAIQQVASRCGPNDTFVWCYAGHGTQVTDYDGDEVDGQDEAYVLVDRAGKAIPPNEGTLLTDDEFCNWVTRFIPPSVTVVIFSDCCHSGTICDFKKTQWCGRKAISISGCRDTETSGDTGNGGICTHALLLAAESLQKKGKTNYTVGELFRETVKIDDTVFASAQNITINCVPGFTPKDFTWPLTPRCQFAAPYNKGGAAQPQPAFAQPQPAYAQPQPAFAQPQPAYAQPQPAYAQPQPAYIQPQPQAYVQQPAYVQPAYFQQPATSFMAQPQTAQYFGGGMQFASPYGGGYPAAPTYSYY